MTCGGSRGSSNAVVVCAQSVWITAPANCAGPPHPVSRLQYHDAAAVLPGLDCHLEEANSSVANHKGPAIVRSLIQAFFQGFKVTC